MISSRWHALDNLITDEAENSTISTEDFAAAVLDEIETPTLIQQRFTVTY